MPKLPPENKFLDLSDYGRFVARWIAKSLLYTFLTPVHVTFGFLIVGVLAIYCILQGFYWGAAIFLILKSILDAADGELSRLRKKPSYIGRYLDSNFDFLLNFGFLYAIGLVGDAPLWMVLLAFFAIQLQGTLYNYYYIILRNSLAGSDKTSRVEERSTPKALHGENQQMVNFLFAIFTLFYGGFDRLVIALDTKAKYLKHIPSWFMSLVSLYGLGFQLLLMALMLVLGLVNYIIPFFVYYTVLMLVFLGIRRIFVKNFGG